MIGVCWESANRTKSNQILDYLSTWIKDTQLRAAQRQAEAEGGEGTWNNSKINISNCFIQECEYYSDEEGTHWQWQLSGGLSKLAEK